MMLLTRLACCQLIIEMLSLEKRAANIILTAHLPSLRGAKRRGNLKIVNIEVADPPLAESILKPYQPVVRQDIEVAPINIVVGGNANVAARIPLAISRFCQPR